MAAWSRQWSEVGWGMRVRPLLWASLTLTLAPILSEDNESCGPHPRAGLLDTSPPLTYKGLLGALWRMSFHTWRDSRPERTMGTNPTAVCWSHTHHGGGCRVSQDSPGVGALLFDLGETGAGGSPSPGAEPWAYCLLPSPCGWKQHGNLAGRACPLVVTPGNRSFQLSKRLPVADTLAPPLWARGGPTETECPSS